MLETRCLDAVMLRARCTGRCWIDIVVQNADCLWFRYGRWTVAFSLHDRWRVDEVPGRRPGYGIGMRMAQMGPNG